MDGPDIVPGDVVRVIDDMAEVHRLQKDGRGWDDNMALVSRTHTHTHTHTHTRTHTHTHTTHAVFGTARPLFTTVGRWVSSGEGEWKKMALGPSLSHTCSWSTA